MGSEAYVRTEYYQEMPDASLVFGAWASPDRRCDADAPNPVFGEIAFRRFRVRPGARQLLRDGHPVEIGSRAFDLLLVLIASRGFVVPKAQIFRSVWLSTVVHEGNLRFQMTSLRKLLGPDRDIIKTIPGRGYLFVAEEVTGGLDERVPSRLALLDPLRGLHLDDCSAEARKGPLIIVIDDDQDACAKVAERLRSAGFRVECYRSVDAFQENGRASHSPCPVLDACALPNCQPQPTPANGGVSN